jgi:hypothetical protein
MITRFLVGALMLAPVAAGAQQTTPAAPAAQRTTPTVDSAARPAANPADVATEDAILAALYDVISGPAGKARDWDRMRSLFVPGARLIPTGIGRDGAVRHRVMTVEDYVKGSGPMLEKEGFFENEVARTTERFGNVAHAFSTYESRHKAGEAPFARGINSIQLLNDGTRWWVVTIFWDSEREGNPIPARYLPGR